MKYGNQNNTGDLGLFCQLECAQVTVLIALALTKFEYLASQWVSRIYALMVRKLEKEAEKEGSNFQK